MQLCIAMKTDDKFKLLQAGRVKNAYQMIRHISCKLFSYRPLLNPVLGRELTYSICTLIGACH